MSLTLETLTHGGLRDALKVIKTNSELFIFLLSFKSYMIMTCTEPVLQLQ